MVNATQRFSDGARIMGSSTWYVRGDMGKMTRDIKRGKKNTKTPNGETLEALGTDSGCQRSKGDRGLTET